jgi:hypothetical protein
VDKKRHDELTMEQEFELRIGPHGYGQSAFPSEAARRAAWDEHRDELVAADAPEHPCWAAREYDGARQDDQPTPDAGSSWTPGFECPK